MIDKQWALAFAQDWIDAWNARDMDRILAHYTDDFEMSSPLIVARVGLPGGTLKGREAVRDYWQPSVAMEPPLRFELIDVFVGVEAVTLYYNSVGRRRVAETFFIDSTGKVTRGMALWSVTQA